MDSAAAIRVPILRRFFEVDAECTSIGVLYALSQRGQIPASVVAGAIRDLGVNPRRRSASVCRCGATRSHLPSPLLSITGHPD